jgi:hypothetical protein
MIQNQDNYICGFSLRQSWLQSELYISILQQSCRQANDKFLSVSGIERHERPIAYPPIPSYWITTSSTPPSPVLTCTGRRNFLAMSSLSCSNTQSRWVYTNTLQSPHRHEHHLPLWQTRSLDVTKKRTGSKLDLHVSQRIMSLSLT